MTHHERALESATPVMLLLTTATVEWRWTTLKACTSKRCPGTKPLIQRLRLSGIRRKSRPPVIAGQRWWRCDANRTVARTSLPPFVSQSQSNAEASSPLAASTCLRPPFDFGISLASSGSAGGFSTARLTAVTRVVTSRRRWRSPVTIAERLGECHGHRRNRPHDLPLHGRP